MNTIQQILNIKGQEVWSVTSATSVYDAMMLMSAKNIGALLVQNGQELVGIFSERDYARKMILENKTSQDAKVSEFMTRKVVYIQPEQTVNDCMALMADRRIRHMPVLDDNKKVIGLVSVMDIVKAIISDQQCTIEQLEQFIYHD